MAVGTSLTELTALELGARIERRELSPVEVMRQVLARLDETEPMLTCFLSRRDEAALAEARAAEAEIVAGAYRGPLHGIPVGVKDNLAVAGTVTTAGTRVLAPTVTAEDAEVIRRLRLAGAIVVGKTNLHEFAFGSTTINPHFGTTRNPWRTDCVAGGSSGGSAAAVAARQVPLAIGTDHAGSIRIPASLCGVVGVKPTHGRVSLRGLVGARNASADHVGPMARTVADAALLLGAMAGHDPLDPTSMDRTVPAYLQVLAGGLAGLRVGVPTDYYFDLLEPEIESGVRGAIAEFQRLGAELVDVAIPELEEMMVVREALSAEGLATLDPYLRTVPEQLGVDVRRLSYALYFVTGRDLARANRVRRLMCDRFAELFRRVDLLATPTTCVAAFPIEASTVAVRDARTGRDVHVAAAAILLRLTSPANLVGVPAISVPAGLTSDGLPFGLQLHARPFEEGLLLCAAHAYEQARATS